MATINNGLLDGVRKIAGRFRDLVIEGGLPGVPLGFRLRGATASGAPTKGTWRTGDMVPDRTGAWWTCTAAGTPGTWVTASGSGLPLSGGTMTGPIAGFEDKGGQVFNVTAYGATGNGSTNDTAAVQAAITAALAVAPGSAVVYFPPGTYLCNSSLTCTSASGSGGYGVMLVGAGRQASTILKGFSGALVTYNGSGGYAGNPSVFGGTANITLAGDGSHTGALLQTNSAQQMHFFNTNFVSNPDVTLDLGGMEDCYWTGCTSNNCGSATAPVISIYSISANTGNMLWFTQLRLEAFAGPAIWIKQGSGVSGSPGNNGFFFSQCKFETTTVHSDIIVADASVQQLYFDQVFFALDAFTSGYSTAANCISFGGSTGASGDNQFSLTNCWVHSATGVLNSVLNLNGATGDMSGPLIIDNLNGDNFPVTSVFIVNSAAGMDCGFRNIYVPGTMFTGDGSYWTHDNGSTSIMSGLGIVNGYVGQTFPVIPTIFVFSTGLSALAKGSGTGTVAFAAGAADEDPTTVGSVAFAVTDNDKVYTLNNTLDDGTGKATFTGSVGAAGGTVDAEQFVALTTTYTLATGTALQKLFNATTNGALTVAASTSYFFECEFDLSSTPSGAISFGFGGTATLTSLKYTAVSEKGATNLTTPTTPAFVAGTAAAAQILVATTTAGTGVFTSRIRGIVRINATGTLVPEVAVDVSTTTAAVVGTNSFFRVWPVGSNTAVDVGNWS